MIPCCSIRPDDCISIEELMAELSDIKALIQPDEILLTVDAMTGQDIVNVAQSFHDQLSVTGLVLTKLDGDSRRRAVSSRYVPSRMCRSCLSVSEHAI